MNGNSHFGYMISFGGFTIRQFGLIGYISTVIGKFIQQLFHEKDDCEDNNFIVNKCRKHTKTSEFPTHWTLIPDPSYRIDFTKILNHKF